MWYRVPNCWPIFSGPEGDLPPAETGSPVVSGADGGTVGGCGGRDGGANTVSASSLGTGVSRPVALEDGSRALQAGQRPTLSDTSPAQFGHLITRARPQGRLPARFPLLRLCGSVWKSQSPKGTPTRSNVSAGPIEHHEGRQRPALAIRSRVDVHLPDPVDRCFHGVRHAEGALLGHDHRGLLG